MVQVSSRLEFSRESYDSFTNSRVFFWCFDFINRVVICYFARQWKRDNIIENYKEFFR
jgi:hypothetical protein